MGFRSSILFVSFLSLACGTRCSRTCHSKPRYTGGVDCLRRRLFLVICVTKTFGWGLVSDSAVMTAVTEIAKSDEDGLVSRFSCQESPNLSLLKTTPNIFGEVLIKWSLVHAVTRRHATHVQSPPPHPTQ